MCDDIDPFNFTAGVGITAMMGEMMKDKLLVFFVNNIQVIL